MIGGRLREERERLGVTQAALSAIVGAGKRTVIDWEKGVTAPTAVQLAAMADAGFDVLYILTNQRASPPSGDSLSRREAALLDNYRHSPAEGKDAIERTASALAKPAGTVKKAG